MAERQVYKLHGGWLEVEAIPFRIVLRPARCQPGSQRAPIPRRNAADPLTGPQLGDAAVHRARQL